MTRRGAARKIDSAVASTVEGTWTRACTLEEQELANMNGRPRKDDVLSLSISLASAHLDTEAWRCSEVSTVKDTDSRLISLMICVVCIEWLKPETLLSAVSALVFALKVPLSISFWEQHCDRAAGAAGATDTLIPD
eukprot:5221648-Prymnesium_polylepis.1